MINNNKTFNVPGIWNYNLILLCHLVNFMVYFTKSVVNEQLKDFSDLNEVSKF